MTRILIFGDSVAHGAYEEGGGWVERLRNFFYERWNKGIDSSFYSVYNLGVSGNTSEDLISRLEFETNQRSKCREANEELILIIEIGKNDSAFSESKNNFWVLAEKFRENIKKLIETARGFSLNIVFVGLSPLDDLKSNPASFDEDLYYKKENAKKYNEILKSICQENRVHFINIFEKFMNTDYKNLLLDGVHPNSKGHQKIFEIVKEFLIDNKII